MRISDWSSDVCSSDLDLYHEFLDAGVIAKDAEGNATSEGSMVPLVYGQMNEPPGARARVALSGLTIAEYFRDVVGQYVLFFVDNLFRIPQAGSEVPALLDRTTVEEGKSVLLCEESRGRRRITKKNP